MGMKRITAKGNHAENASGILRTVELQPAFVKCWVAAKNNRQDQSS